jgi:hypothetical protein
VSRTIFGSSGAQLATTFVAARTNHANTFSGTGAPTTADTGQTYALTNSGGTGDGLSIIGGKLTNTATHAGLAAGYAQVTHAQNVNRVGARFTFGAYTTTNGAAVVGIWAAPLNSSYPVIPNAPCHLVITPTAWNYGVFQGNALTNIASGQFSSPLATDGTEHRVDVVINGTTATLLLPDGSLASVTDSRIASLAGRHAFVEVYALDANTDSKAAFTAIWSDDGTPTAPGDVLPLLVGTRNLTAPTVVQSAPVSNADVAVPTSETNVDGTALAVTFTVPAGCTAVEVTLRGALAMTAPGQVLWGYREGATTQGMATVVNGQVTGNVGYSHVWSGLVPGSTHTITWRHWCVQSGVATFKREFGAGYWATMKVTPIL